MSHEIRRIVRELEPDRQILSRCMRKILESIYARGSALPDGFDACDEMISNIESGDLSIWNAPDLERLTICCQSLPHGTDRSIIYVFLGAMQELAYANCDTQAAIQRLVYLSMMLYTQSPSGEIAANHVRSMILSLQ